MVNIMSFYPPKKRTKASKPFLYPIGIILIALVIVLLLRTSVCQMTLVVNQLCLFTGACLFLGIVPNLVSKILQYPYTFSNLHRSITCLLFSFPKISLLIQAALACLNSLHPLQSPNIGIFSASLCTFYTCLHTLCFIFHAHMLSAFYPAYLFASHIGYKKPLPYFHTFTLGWEKLVTNIQVQLLNGSINLT